MSKGKPEIRRKLHVRKGDLVIVISGEDKGDRKNPDPREVIAVNIAGGKVTVRGTNMQVKNLRKSQANPKGGRIEKELEIDVSKVMLWDPKANRPVRSRRVFLKDDKGNLKLGANKRPIKARVSAISGEPIGTTESV